MTQIDPAGIDPLASQALKKPRDAHKRLGDLDGDGTVGFSDLLQLTQDQGTTNIHSDVNGDGAVDRDDLSILSGFYGKDIGALIAEEGLQGKRLGDLNGDNKVDFSDLLSLAQNLNTTNQEMDINADGSVTESDLQILSGYYGANIASFELKPSRIFPPSTPKAQATKLLPESASPIAALQTEPTATPVQTKEPKSYSFSSSDVKFADSGRHLADSIKEVPLERSSDELPIQRTRRNHNKRALL